MIRRDQARTHPSLVGVSVRTGARRGDRECPNHPAIRSQLVERLDEVVDGVYQDLEKALDRSAS